MGSITEKILTESGYPVILKKLVSPMWSKLCELDCIIDNFIAGIAISVLRCIGFEDIELKLICAGLVISAELTGQ